MKNGKPSEAASAGISVTPVTSRRLRKDFLDLPLSIYSDDPNWITPLRMTEAKRLNRKKHPFFKHGDAEFWIAYKNGRPVGRISAQVNYLHLERFNDATGHFGMIEAVDEQEVFDRLFEAAIGWLRERGLKRVLGPFSLSINEEAGLLVDGFETPPAVMTCHARRYYGERIESAGFDKAKDLFAFRFYLGRKQSRIWARLVEVASRNPEISAVASNKGRMEKDFAEAIDIFNDAWSENWGFVPITEAEVEDIGRELKPFIPPEFIQFGVVNGVRSAIVIAMPDLNQAAEGLNGRLLPFGWIVFLWRVKIRGLTRARMPLLGVRRAYQEKAIAAFLSISLIDSIHRFGKQLGLETAELGWVLEDNHGLLKIIEMVGAERYKTYRVYEKDIQ